MSLAARLRGRGPARPEAVAARAGGVPDQRPVAALVCGFAALAVLSAVVPWA